jgi:hypothetical protein
VSSEPGAAHIDKLAGATGLARIKIEENIDAKKEAATFWAPWADSQADASIK